MARNEDGDVRSVPRALDPRASQDTSLCSDDTEKKART